MHAAVEDGFSVSCLMSSRKLYYIQKDMDYVWQRTQVLSKVVIKIDARAQDWVYASIQA
jgi:hypothetical protein